jgi:hypothetical protein
MAASLSLRACAQVKTLTQLLPEITTPADTDLLYVVKPFDPVAITVWPYSLQLSKSDSENRSSLFQHDASCFVRM